MTFYPVVADDPATMCTRSASTSYPGRQDDDADRPAALILQLQSTLIGCEWLLGEWARLQTILNKHRPWISADKLKAVRLLGRQPFDAIDDDDVALVFLASHRLKLKRKMVDWDWEILTEMDESNRKRFRADADDRELESLMPADAAAAREALSTLIQRETERLRTRAQAHRQRERVKATRAADLLAFDETPEGERLRRFEITSGRGYTRAIDTFLKLRRAASIGILSDGSLTDGQLSVVSGPLSGDARATGEDLGLAISEANGSNEPRPAPEIDTTWALRIDTHALHGDRRIDGALSVVGGSLLGDACTPLENLTNEPTAGLLSVASGQLSGDAPTAPENVTNEPIDGPSSGRELAPSDNATNEPTAGPLPVVGDRSLGDQCRPSANVANEPKSVGYGDDDLARNPGGGRSSVLGDVLMVAPCSSGCREMKAAPNNSSRRAREALNNHKSLLPSGLRTHRDETLRAVMDVMAARRAHRREQRNQISRPRIRLQRRLVGTGQGRCRENTPHSKRGGNRLRKIEFVTFDEENPAPSACLPGVSGGELVPATRK